jgi:hypothetical protein
MTASVMDCRMVVSLLLRGESSSPLSRPSERLLPLVEKELCANDERRACSLRSFEAIARPSVSSSPSSSSSSSSSSKSASDVNDTGFWNSNAPLAPGRWVDSSTSAGMITLTEKAGNYWRQQIQRAPMSSHGETMSSNGETTLFGVVQYQRLVLTGSW